MTPTFPRHVVFHMTDGSNFETGRAFTANDEDAVREATNTMTCNMTDPVFAAVTGFDFGAVCGVEVVTEVNMPPFVPVVNTWSDGGRVVRFGNHTPVVFPHRFPMGGEA